jgi:hypothetical protein
MTNLPERSGLHGMGGEKINCILAGRKLGGHQPEVIESRFDCLPNLDD